MLASLGLVRGVSHSEYIRARDGRLVFLETSARVGGAHIAELIEAATGVNMWAEWAKIEVAGGKTPVRAAAAAARLRRTARLARAAGHRRTCRRTADPEVVWRLEKPNHAGLIVRSPSHARVDELLAQYAERFRHDFVAALPAPATPFD